MHSLPPTLTLHAARPSLFLAPERCRSHAQHQRERARAHRDFFMSPNLLCKQPARIIASHAQFRWWRDWPVSQAQLFPVCRSFCVTVAKMLRQESGLRMAAQERAVSRPRFTRPWPTPYLARRRRSRPAGADRRAWPRCRRGREVLALGPGVPRFVHGIAQADVGHPDRGRYHFGLVGAAQLQEAIDLLEDLLGLPLGVLLVVARR